MTVSSCTKEKRNGRKKKLRHFTRSALNLKSSNCRSLWATIHLRIALIHPYAIHMLQGESHVPRGPMLLLVNSICPMSRFAERSHKSNII